MSRHKEHNGMNCERCFSATRTIDSRQSNDIIRRRRKCIVCEHRFTTFEITQETMRKMMEVQEHARLMQEALATAVGIKPTNVKVPRNLNLKLLKSTSYTA